ncbi:MAG: sulfite exporter TauE/SafE family protein [Coriobacteriales bacterium]|nr:sulfite exporter TauE/SafE family protein [Coriobacteriales bacterium]
MGLFIIAAILGVGIGMLSGMLGIGGGTVMVPLFRLLFGMSPLMSTATSLFAIVPTSISGVVTHLKNKTCIPALGIAAGIGGALMSPVGVWLAQISPDWMVMVAAALVIGYSAINMFRKAAKLPPDRIRKEQLKAEANAASEGKPAPQQQEITIPTLTRKQLLTGLAIGLIAGLASGYVGVGGGFIMVPLMISLIGIQMRHASGTSLIAVMILAIPGVITQAILGNINYTAGIAIVIGTIPGAFLGAKFVRVIPERTLRFTFGGFLLIAAALLAVKEFIL